MACVTLTTDFGTCDGYVGAMKGVILQRCPGVQLVDITHAIPRHDLAHAAFVVREVASSFAPGTIHVVVVDPGVGSERKAVIVSAQGQCFIGPDNGVFELVAPAGSQAHAIVDPRFTAAEVSTTFHGRDIFAPAAGALASGLPMSAAGPALRLTAGGAGQLGPCVVHVDGFGNLVTNVRPGDLGQGFVIAGHRFPELHGTYADVAVGQLLAYVGSSGTVEVAVREGSASKHLGVGRGAQIEVERAHE